MRKYAHIGYPKAASTWLQVHLFPRHPDIHHLGRHNGDEIVDDDLRIALWNDLIMQPALLYKPQEVARTFERLFAEGAARGARACGISQEILTLSMVGSLDIGERARRLRAAMGDDTCIIMVIRTQLEWIRSLFCGLLKEGGMTCGLDEFLFYFYYQQDQSPFSSLFYDGVYEIYADLFGAANVHVVPFEWITGDARAFAGRVCDAIGVSVPAQFPKESINERLSPAALTAALEYNRKHSFYFGASQFHRPLGFAAAPMFQKRFGIEAPSWMADERRKSLFVMENIEGAVQHAQKQGRTIPAMDTSVPPRYRTLLAEAYAPHNQRLMHLTGLDLNRLGYPT